MGARPMMSSASPQPAPPSPPSPSWKLAPAVAAQTQALVVTGFGDLPTGRALFLEFRWPADQSGTGWLAALAQVAPITSADPPGGTDPDTQPQTAALAFTAAGLSRMKLPETAAASFARAFREGMFQEDRLRRLGDRRLGAWQEGVIAGGPEWSGNTKLEDLPPGPPGAFDVPHEHLTGDHVQTAVTVHALLLLYARDDAAANAWASQVEQALAPQGVAVVRMLDLLLDVLKQEKFSREHFGFADALSQPFPYDPAAVLVGGQPAVQHPVQGVPLGDFLMGYMDGHHAVSPGPVVPADAVPGGTPADAGLQPSANAEGFFDLGLNGSYMVVRELKQYVAAFWQSMAANAAAITQQDPDSAGIVTADWLAERVVGRDRDGHLLCPAGAKLAPLPDGTPDSNYGFFDTDPRGAGCPVGSHVRRAFPRDALAPTPDQKQTLLAAANNHRILRRGRKFGPPATDPLVDDGADRGLLFMCLNTDIDRQFEFVQQTWMLNPSFATLSDEVDPLVGPAGRMTIRDRPVRRTVQVDTFIKLAGGDYFFLPSLPALRYLAML